MNGLVMMNIIVMWLKKYALSFNCSSISTNKLVSNCFKGATGIPEVN